MSDIRCRESSTGEFESRGTSVEYAAFRAAVPWMKDEDALLGNLTDRELAEKLNRSLGAVRDRRKFLGKSAVGHPPQTFRTEREPCDHYAHLFATKSNQGLRVILGWSYRRMHNRRRRLAGGHAQVGSGGFPRRGQGDASRRRP